MVHLHGCFSFFCIASTDCVSGQEFKSILTTKMGALTNDLKDGQNATLFTIRRYIQEEHAGKQRYTLMEGCTSYNGFHQEIAIAKKTSSRCEMILRGS